MKYYNPRNSSTAKKRPPRYNQREYKKLSIPEKHPTKLKTQLFTLPRIIALSCVALAVIITSAVIFPNIANAQYSDAYEVILCGKSIGIVSDPDAVDKFLTETRDQQKAKYNMKTTDQLDVEYRAIKSKQEHICPASTFNNLIEDCIDVKILASIIYVNDWPAAVLKTHEEAEWVLAQAKHPYENPTKDAVYSDIGFVETVKIDDGPADYSQIVDKETALHNLTIGPGVEDRWHIVVTGESISRIAKKEGVKKSDILIANPNLSTSDKIYPGDKIRVVAPLNSISIRYKVTIDSDNYVKPYETQVIEDNTKYTYEQTVKQEGINGKSHVKAEITYINGIEVAFDILEEQVLEAPQAKIIEKGTKATPKELKLAMKGRMPIPIQEGKYTIGDKFGPRTPPCPGASSYHKGIDLKANKGTPIYASQDGTVSYSGVNGGYGNFVKIKHSGGVETRYGHCYQLLVSKGEKVKQGDIIALVGSTGVSTGSHLHFEVRINGEAVNPLK